MTLHAAIVQTMRAKGLSINQLAKLAGINQPTLSRYVNGHRDMTGERIDKVMKALGLTVCPHHTGVTSVSRQNPPAVTKRNNRERNPNRKSTRGSA